MAHMFDVFIKEWRFIGVGNFVRFGVSESKGLAHMFDVYIKRSDFSGGMVAFVGALRLAFSKLRSESSVTRRRRAPRLHQLCEKNCVPN